MASRIDRRIVERSTTLIAPKLLLQYCVKSFRICRSKPETVQHRRRRWPVAFGLRERSAEHVSQLSTIDQRTTPTNEIRLSAEHAVKRQTEEQGDCDGDQRDDDDSGQQQFD